MVVVCRLAVCALCLVTWSRPWPAPPDLVILAGDDDGRSVACSTRTPAPATEERPAMGDRDARRRQQLHARSIKDRETEMRAAMAMALAAGHRILAAGGSSLDAVQAAVVVLEDSPHFNAGKGAVFTHRGHKRAGCGDHGRRNENGRRRRWRETHQEPNPARATGHGTVAARDDGGRWRRGVREGTRRH